MVLLIAAGFFLVGFFACLTPFWVLTPLVTEFVVSPTHDYTSFSSYGSDVFTCIQFNLNFFLFLSFLFCSFGDAGMLRILFLLLFSVPCYCMFYVQPERQVKSANSTPQGSLSPGTRANCGTRGGFYGKAKNLLLL